MGAIRTERDLPMFHYLRPIGLANFRCFSTGESQGQEVGVVGRGVGGGLWGTFGIALGM
jgi:hypothetical protein